MVFLAIIFLLLDKGSKGCDVCVGCFAQCLRYWDSHRASRYKVVIFQYMKLSALVSENDSDFADQMEKSTAKIKKIEAKRGLIAGGQSSGAQNEQEILHDPAPCKSNGRGKGWVSSSSVRSTQRRVLHCSTCGGPGHNWKTCSARRHCSSNAHTCHLNGYNEDPIDEDMDEFVG